MLWSDLRCEDIMPGDQPVLFFPPQPCITHICAETKACKRYIIAPEFTQVGGRLRRCFGRNVKKFSEILRRHIVA